MGCGFKSLLGIAAVIVVATSCRISFNGYSFDYQGAQAERNEIGEIDSAVTSVVVENKFGLVTVSRTDSEVGWSWTGTCWSTQEEDAEAFLEELTIDVAQSGTTQTWSIELPKKDKKLRGVRSNLEILVPESMNVTIVNKHGDSSVEYIAGDVNVKNQHGDVTVKELSGKVDIQNQHGKVAAENLTLGGKFNVQHGDLGVLQAEGPLEIESAHGKVQLQGAAANIDIGLSHSDLNSTNTFGDVKFRVAHGDVNLQMTHSDFGSITGDASHSGIVVKLPKNCKPDVKVDLSHGRVRSDVASDTASSSKIKIDGSHTNVSIQAENE